MTVSIDSYKTWKWKCFHNRRAFVTSFMLLYCGFTCLYSIETINIIQEEMNSNSTTPMKWYTNNKNLFSTFGGVYFALFAVYSAYMYIRVYNGDINVQKAVTSDDHFNSLSYYFDYIFSVFAVFSMIITSTMSFFNNIAFEKVSFSLMEMHLSRMSNVLHIFGFLFSLNHTGCNDMFAWVIFIYYCILWCSCMVRIRITSESICIYVYYYCIIPIAEETRIILYYLCYIGQCVGSSYDTRSDSVDYHIPNSGIVQL